MKNRTNRLNTNRFRKFNKTHAFILLIFLAISATAVSFYIRYNNAVSNPQAQLEQKNSRETKDIINRLGKILSLPSNKQPTVAKVEDVEKLKKTNENFYKDVTKEDYLVLYSDRAIIYRKKENKIINIAPIVDTSKMTPEISQPSQDQEEAQTP